MRKHRKCGLTAAGSSPQPPVGVSGTRRLGAPSGLAHVAAMACLLSLSGVLQFYGLGSNGLHELDEAVHAQAALEMYRTGDWWRPTAFGSPFFDKPALPTWLTVCAYHILGPTVFATRMWAALFAVGAVLATYLLGKRLAGVPVGFVAGLSLASSYGFVYKHCGRTGEFDSMMIFFFVASTLMFHRALETNKGWVLTAAIAAMASHAKNLSGLVPAFVFVVTLMACQTKHRPDFRQWVLCTFAFGVLNLVWIVPMGVIHGSGFLEHYVLNEVLARPSKAVQPTTLGVMFVHAHNVLVGFYPWVLLGLAGLPEDGRKAVYQRDSGSILVITWIVVLGAVLCLLLRRGLQWYVIPLFPFLAICGSRFLVGRDERPAWANGWRAVACIAIVGATVCLERLPEAYPFALWSIRRLYLVWSNAPRAALLILTAVVAVAAAAAWSYGSGRPVWRDGRLARWPALAALTVAALSAVVRPLEAVGYQNAYARAQQALARACGEGTAFLVVAIAKRRPDRLTQYYFGNIDRFHTSYLRYRPRQALALAKASPAPAFLALISGRPPPFLVGTPGRLIFSGSEPWRKPPAKIYVTVFQIHGNAGGARGASASGREGDDDPIAKRLAARARR